MAYTLGYFAVLFCRYLEGTRSHLLANSCRHFAPQGVRGQRGRRADASDGHLDGDCEVLQPAQGGSANPAILNPHTIPEGSYVVLFWG